MTPHLWVRIVARAQEAHYLRRWEAVMRDMGDGKAADGCGRRAARAEAMVLDLARAAGCEVETIELEAA